MNYKQLCIMALLLNAAPLNQCMMKEPTEKIKQFAVIQSFLENHNSILALTSAMDTIEEKKRGYPDYAGRVGGIWTDFWVEPK